MTKLWLGPTLLLAIVGLAQSPAPKTLPKPSPGSTTKVSPSNIPIEVRFMLMQAQIDQLRDAMNHDIPILNERTLDLNNRLHHFEDQMGPGPANRAMAKIQAELNDVDARVAQLERPEVEDDAK